MVGELKTQKNKMRKTIVIIIFGIALISLASAETMYAGECLGIDLSELESLDNVVYDVVGNSSNLEGLTISLNGTIASICTVTNYKPDSFTIIFTDNSTKEIIKEVNVYHKRKTKIEYVDRNITVYVPEYIDKIIIETKEVEKIIEKTIDKIIYVERGYEFWKVILAGVLGVIFYWGVLKLTKKEEFLEEPLIDELNEEVDVDLNNS